MAVEGMIWISNHSPNKSRDGITNSWLELRLTMFVNFPSVCIMGFLVRGHVWQISYVMNYDLSSFISHCDRSNKTERERTDTEKSNEKMLSNFPVQSSLLTTICIHSASKLKINILNNLRGLLRLDLLCPLVLALSNKSASFRSKANLTHCGLMAPHGIIELGQHWFRQWPLAVDTNALPETIGANHQWGFWHS